MMVGPDDGFELPASTHIGQVALRVGSLDHVLPFYRDVLGFDIERTRDHARLMAGEQTLLTIEKDSDIPARSSDAAGLFHVAVRVSDRSALADVLGRIHRNDAALSGAADHRVSESLYLRDPEDNGIEVYRDHPRESWPRTDDGSVGIDTLSLDVDELSEEATSRSTFPKQTDIGHVHLEVTDLGRAETFYANTVGFEVKDRYGDEATFTAAGDYHHHIGLNIWNHRQSPATETRGLQSFEIVVPNREIVETVHQRLRAAGYHPMETDEAVVVSDPDNVRIRLVAESQCSLSVRRDRDLRMDAESEDVSETVNSREECH